MGCYLYDIVYEFIVKWKRIKKYIIIVRNLSDSLLKFSIIIWNFIICRKNWNFLSFRRTGRNWLTVKRNLWYIYIYTVYYMRNSWYTCICDFFLLQQIYFHPFIYCLKVVGQNGICETERSSHDTLNICSEYHGFTGPFVNFIGTIEDKVINYKNSIVSQWCTVYMVEILRSNSLKYYNNGIRFYDHTYLSTQYFVISKTPFQLGIHSEGMLSSI